jgi:hypothetical protein
MSSNGTLYDKYLELVVCKNFKLVKKLGTGAFG